MIDNQSDKSVPEMTWNPDDDKLYEDALKEFPEEDDNRWEKIAGQVPGKSPHDIKAHFEDLFVDSILLDVPYNEANADPIDHPIDTEISLGHIEASVQSDDSSKLSSRSSSEVVNNQSYHWIEEEHRYYLHTYKHKYECIHRCQFCSGFLYIINFLTLIFIFAQNIFYHFLMLILLRVSLIDFVKIFLFC